MKNLFNEVTRLVKGTKMLLLIMFGTIFLSLFIQSCMQDDTGYISGASKENLNFKSSLEKNKKSIGSVLLGGSVPAYARINQSSNSEIYLNFPETTNNINVNDLFQNVSTIQELSDLIDQTSATIQYEENSSNSNYQLSVSIEDIETSLQPLVDSAKQYLYAKGFTPQTLNNMLVTENGTEEDLILFVMNLIEIERNQSIAKNYSIPFVNYAYAKLDYSDYLRCAGVALGADALWALGGSSASSWTIAAMTRAFSAVAKRFLGPIGVAIAVVSFGVCIHEAYYD